MIVMAVTYSCYLQDFVKHDLVSELPTSVLVNYIHNSDRLLGWIVYLHLQVQIGQRIPVWLSEQNLVHPFVFA